jgi:hypothetical protein
MKVSYFSLLDDWKDLKQQKPKQSRSEVFQFDWTKEPRFYRRESTQATIVQIATCVPRDALGADAVDLLEAVPGKLNAIFPCNCLRSALKIGLSLIPNGKAEE